MTILKWDQSGEKYFETGVSNVVLYKFDTKTKKFGVDVESYAIGDICFYDGDKYKCKTAVTDVTTWDGTKWEKVSPYTKSADGKGIAAWSGVTGITESPSGAEANDVYADNIKYLTRRSKEEFGCTIEAFTYPDEWGECDGSVKIGTNPVIRIGQQARATFGLSYITKVGNDTKDDEYGEKVHLVYGGTAAPSERAYATVNESPENITFSWEVSTVPVEIEGEPNLKPVAHVELENTDPLITETAWKNLMDALHGTATTEPYLPLPGDIYDIMFPAAG